MHRYENAEGTHAKFWTIDHAGKKLTTSWGRIGTAGQSKTKSFASEAIVEKEVARLVAEKLRGGYKKVTGTTARLPDGALSPLERWALGEALLGTDDRKLSGRVDFMWGIPDGASLPSKGGRLRIGDAEHHKKSVVLEAAPGSGDNPLFSVHATIDDERISFEGVRLRAAMPVAWKIQTPIPIRRQRPYGGRGTAAIWTPGLAPKVLKDRGFVDGKRARSRSLWAVDDRLHWVLGLGADGEPVCVLAGGTFDVLFAGGADPIARPDDAALAALRAEPQRDAIPAADLHAFAEAIRKRAVKRPKKSDQSVRDEWVKVRPFSRRLELSFCTTPDGVVPSAKGELCFGNLSDPKSAVRIRGGRANNAIMTVEHTVWETGRGEERTRFHETLRGVRLSDQRPVRWQLMGELTPTKTRRDDPQYLHIGFWTPGIERTSPADFDGKSYVSPHAGVFCWKVHVKRARLGWLVGFDAKDRPACVLAAELRPSGRYGAYRLGDYFAFASEAVGKADARKAVRAAKAEAEAAIARAAADEAAEHPLTPATRAELDAIATAISAGPTKAKKRINKRFSVSWDEAAVPAVGGKLCVGDPSGAEFEITAGDDGPKQVFRFDDEENDEAAGWGRVVLGVRLGAGKAVRWKPSIGLGVDSGQYGVWSPGFPTDDVDRDGLHVAGDLVAKIQATAEGDCGFPSLVGLDAAKKPVVFLFGEALRPAVFQRA